VTAGIDFLLQDARYALRTLGKNPGFTVAAVLTLAIGIGANSAIFSIVESVILRPLPYRESYRLAVLADGMSTTDVEALQVANHSFEDMAVYYRPGGRTLVTLTAPGEPEPVQGGFVSAGFFPILGIAPIAGRWFTQEEETRHERVILLAHSLWLRRFAGDRDAIGQTLQIDGAERRVIGVMPAAFQFPARDVQFWAPITTNRFWGEKLPFDPNLNRNAYARWFAVARLKERITLEQAQSEMTVLNARLEQTAPDRNRAPAIHVEPLRADVSADTRTALYALYGAVLCMLLIACSNVANLLLARGATRQRELALRTALGAGRGRLVRQLLAESGILTALATALGLLLAAFSVRALITFGPTDIPRLDQAGLDARVLVFTVAVSACVALVCGLVPSWKASRVNPNDALKGGGRGTSVASATRRIRSAFVVIVCTLSALLLMSAGLLVRSFVAVTSVDPGFQAEHVVTLRVTLPGGAPASRRSALDADTLTRVSAIPGVQAVGAISSLFETPPGSFGLRSVDGQPPEPKTNWTPLAWNTVRGDYFQAMGAPILRGRSFSDRDDAGSPLVAVVDETLARRYWPGQDPIGKRFKGFDTRRANDEWLTVIGVARDMRRHGVERQPAGHVYEWYKQTPGNATPDLIVRTAGDPSALASTIRAVVRNVDGAAILSPATTLEQRLSDQLSARRFQTWLLGLFSIVALLLAALGVYAMSHHAVVQRRREIGIRMALGAQSAAVMRMVIGRGVWLAGIGVAIGLAGAGWTTRLLTNLLYGVKPFDPITFATVPVVLLVAAALASSIPAWRAVRVDPLTTLAND
jgi:putative ABC transport system permease protein